MNTEVFEDGPLLFFCVQWMPEDTRMLDSKADTPHQSREKAEPTSMCTRSANATNARAVLPYLVAPPARRDQWASGSITWELLRNANYWGPLQTPEAGTGHGWGGGSILCLKKPSG